MYLCRPICRSVKYSSAFLKDCCLFYSTVRCSAGQCSAPASHVRTPCTTLDSAAPVVSVRYSQYLKFCIHSNNAACHILWTFCILCLNYLWNKGSLDFSFERFEINRKFNMKIQRNKWFFDEIVLAVPSVECLAYYQCPVRTREQCLCSKKYKNAK